MGGRTMKRGGTGLKKSSLLWSLSMWFYRHSRRIETDLVLHSIRERLRALDDDPAPSEHPGATPLNLPQRVRHIVQRQDALEKRLLGHDRRLERLEDDQARLWLVVGIDKGGL